MKEEIKVRIFYPVDRKYIFVGFITELNNIDNRLNSDLFKYELFSGGKDRTVMLFLALDEAIKRNRKIGLFLVDLEGQYKMTIKHMEDILDKYKDHLEIYWFCLPIALRNAVSVYEPKWICWDKEKDKD